MPAEASLAGIDTIAKLRARELLVKSRLSDEAGVINNPFNRVRCIEKVGPQFSRDINESLK